MRGSLFSLVGLREAFGRSVGALRASAGQLPIETLEDRRLLSYMDIIGLNQLRADPLFSSIDGQGVTVAVLDTGVDGAHRDLSANFLGGFDAVNGESLPVDRQGHGTHVAGLVGSSNPTIGVATRAGIVGVKVLGDNGSGSNRDIAEGLRWVLDNRTRFNIVAVNMSLGGGFYTSETQVSGDPVIAEIRRLERVGVTVISANGNSYKGRETQNIAAPAIGSTIAVGAVWEDTFSRSVEWGSGATDFTTDEDRITSFSQRIVGESTLFAPGALLRSTTPRNGYADMGGTSQASPVVAGAVALLQDAAMTFAGRLLTPDEVVTTLRATADTIFDGDDEDDNVTNTQVSYPRLNIYRAVQRVREQFGNVPPPPPPPGGGESVADPNGRLSGAAIINPVLDGSETLSITGRIGEDGGSTAIGGRDVDMYKITVASRGNVTLTLSPDLDDREDFNSFLRLFDANGAELANDDNGGDTGYSRLTQNLEPGVYFVGVSGAPNTSYSSTQAGGVAGDTGSYTLSLSLSNADPNGLLSGAVEVRLGDDLAPLEFAGFIGADLGQPVGSSDVDLFRVTVPDNGLLLVDIDTPDLDGFVDSFLRVFDENGNSLGFSDDTAAEGTEFTDASFPGFHFDSAGEFVGHTTDSFLSVRVQRGGVYYFGVSDFENLGYDPTNLDNRLPNGPGGTYQIIVRLVTPDTNGTIEQVRTDTVRLPFANVLGRIGVDSNSTGELFDVGDKDVDFFRIFSNKGGVLEVNIDSFEMSGNTSPFDSVLSIFDGTGKLLGTVDDTTTSVDPLLQYTIAANTSYFVAVSGFGNNNFDPFATGSGSGGETGVYQISAKLLSASATKNLSDDAIGNKAVRTVTVGQSVEGELGTDNGFSSGNADVDFFKFVAPSNGRLTITTSILEAFAADTFLRIFDSKGVELAFNDNISEESRASQASVSVLRGKTYFIGINGASDNARTYNPRTANTGAVGSTGEYQFSVAFDFPPTLTTVANLPTADAGVPFEITWEMLANAANESDPEGSTVNFVVSKVLAGTLTQGGVAVTPGTTVLTPESEPLVWTAPVTASKPTRAFSILASDGGQVSAKAVNVTIPVNTAPTMTTAKAVNVRVDPLAPPTSVTLTFASIQAAANEADKNKDALRFVIDSVLDGTLTIDGVAVTPGQTLFSVGQSLVWTPSTTPAISSIPVSIFTMRAYDGRLYSSLAVTASVKFTR